MTDEQQRENKPEPENWEEPSKVVEPVPADDAGGPLDQEGIDSLLSQLAGGGDVAAAGGGESGLGTGEFSLPEVTSADPDPEASAVSPQNQIELLKDVNVKVKVELGRGAMYLREILRLTQGSVVELDKLAGDPLDVYVNDRLIAKGEVLVLNENFCIRITEIFSPREVLRLKG
jgi:flagellar motor switch protein FliN/FliY